MDPILLLLLFAVAAVYASVGHGGASGYLAVLTLLAAGMGPDQMRAGALVLNVLVAGTAWIAFARAGHFRRSLVVPFLILSLPAAFLGGVLEVSAGLYAPLLASVLAWAGLRLMWRDRAVAETVPPRWGVALPTGAGIGFLSGVVGVGGGIFLSPLMILLRWADAKKAAAASACFIVVNSAAGLAGTVARTPVELGSLLPMVGAAFVGGLLGSTLGARWIPGVWLRRLLGVVLLVAAGKLILSLMGRTG